MEAEIVKHGGSIKTAHPVLSIDWAESENGAFILNSDYANPFKACIVSLSLPRFVEIVPTLPRDYREQLARIDYSHSVCMILRMKKPLSSFYWINIGDEKIPFAVIVEHTNWIEDEDYLGQHVVYLSRYGDRSDDFAWNMPDPKLFDAYCGHLKNIFKDFHESQVLGYHICRDFHTQPIFKAHYSLVLPPFKTPQKNLFLVNSSQFYPRSRCMNTSFILAQEFLSYWRGMEDRV
jgi:protoporphyrinogen oxidase